MTGHLVLTTLHANNAHSAIDRLRNFGIEDDLLSDNLLAVTAQRLVHRLCPNCSQSVDYKGPYTAHFDYVSKPGNCEQCNSGFQGRVLVQEILSKNDELRSMIAQGKNSKEIRNLQLKQGVFQDIFHYGINLVRTGKTNVEALEESLGPLVEAFDLNQH